MEQVSMIGIDLAKNSFQLHGARSDGSVAFRKKLSRGKVLEFLASQPGCTVAMEACIGAHYWGREIGDLGHSVRLIPPQYVKPYVKRQKNDAADAEAVCEAASRPTMNFVAIKTAEQQAHGMLFRTRDLLVRQRTQTINALRGQARALLRIAERLEVARLVLVGDSRQLRGVEAGQPFRQMQQAGMAVVEMDELRRQRNPDLKAAIRDMIEGEPGAALERLGSNLQEVPAEEIAGMAAGLWLRLSPEARAGTALLVPTRALRAEVEAAVREGLEAEGALGGGSMELETLVPLNLTRAETGDIRNWREGDIALFNRDMKHYRIARDDACTVMEVEEDRPTVSVDDATAREGETMQFTVRLSVPLKQVVWVRLQVQESTPVSARAVRDFRMPWFPERVWFRPGETVGQYGVLIHDDSHDDGGETFEVKILSVMNDRAGIDDGLAVGTIENDDPLPGAWLARFGRAVAEQALDGITARMAAPRTPGLRGTIAGQSLDFSDGARLSQSPGSLSGTGGASFGPAGETQSRTMTMQEVLRGASFSLTGEVDGSGGTLAFWGGTPGAGGLVSGSQFAGNQRGDGTAVHLSGETGAALLGTDYAQGPWLVGFALSQSRAEGNYAAIGGDVAARAGDGENEASLTATIPYAALAVSERLKLWGAAGHGSGDVTVKTALGEGLSADTAWSMAAAGLRGDLLTPASDETGRTSGPSLALVSDALWVQTSSEKTRGLAASESDVSRLRLGLEGSWGLALAGGGNIVPKLELGARHDGGDAETGFGVELGGGVAWRDPGLGLTLDLSGRTLVAHDDGGLEDRGISAQLSFDPEPSSGRGLSFGLGQDWGGRSAGGLDALFAPEPLEDREGSTEATSRWAMEAAWGFPAFDGRFTGSPHMGLGLATGGRDYTLGWRLTPEAATAPNLSFGLKATRRENDTAAPEHILGIEATARW